MTSICAKPDPVVYRTVTISGQSAGASIALQHMVAFSAAVEGTAIAAGSPYGCGAQSLHSWTCYYGGLDVDSSVRYVQRRFEQRYIDDPASLRNIPLVLFSGKLDLVVLPNVMHAVEQQMRHFVDGSKISTFYDTRAAHVWSVDDGDCACGACLLQNATGLTRRPCCNVNNCGLDLSGEMLAAFYGRAALRPRTRAKGHHLRWVDQWRYLPAAAGSNASASTMLHWAPVYVPAKCAADVDQCRVHVNYHGCTSLPRNSSINGWLDRLLWVRHIQLNEYAEANNIVVVYPQAAGSDDIGEGCFNWASYEDDPLFDTRLGVQLNTVVNLLNDLRGALNHSWWGAPARWTPVMEYSAPPYE